MVTILEPQKEAKKQEQSLSPQEIVKSVLDVVKNVVSANYAKYFVNNLLIVDGGKNIPSGEESQKFRKEAYEFIDKEIHKESVEKTKMQQYLENFEMRPFYGEGLEKLPKYVKETESYNWDDLYINTDLTKKELGLQ